MMKSTKLSLILNAVTLVLSVILMVWDFMHKKTLAGVLMILTLGFGAATTVLLAKKYRREKAGE